MFLENKLISASAGCGKTFRLSIEYITILLKYREIDFSEITCITFTKKATAEIRERIFKLLEQISSGTIEKPIKKSLEKSLERELLNSDIKYLTNLHKKMLSDTSKVSISTIDGYINKIFSNIVAPYLGISNFTLDNNTLDDDFELFMSRVFEKPEIKQLFDTLFDNSNRRSIHDYKNLFEDIINSLPQLENLPKNPDLIPSNNHYIKSLKVLLESFYQSIKSFKRFNTLLNKPYRIAFGINTLSAKDICRDILNKLSDEDFLRRNYKIFLKSNFWSTRLLDKKRFPDLFELYDAFTNQLVDYLFVAFVLPENRLLQNIFKIVATEYEKIKLTKKLFSHSDITYFTSKYLHLPDSDILEKGINLNFYEKLCSETRFILIDEFQDTSLTQFRILLPIMREILSGSGQKSVGGVILVGDAKQAIYAWRGGDAAIFSNMRHIFPQIQKSTISTSFRSKKRIVNYVNSVFTNSTFFEFLNLKDIPWHYDRFESFQNKRSGYVALYKLNSESKTDYERDFVERILFPFFEKRDFNCGSTAIIARRNKFLANISRILAEKRVEHTTHFSNSLFNHRAITPLLYLFEYYANGDILSLISFLRTDVILLPPKDLKSVLEKYQKNEDLGQLTKYKHIRKILQIEKIEPFEAQIRAIISEFSFLEIFKTEQDASILIQFLSIVKKENIDSAGDLLELAKNRKDDFPIGGSQSLKGINLISIHKSKGLEFDNVFFYQRDNRKHSSYGRLQKCIQYDRRFDRITSSLVSFNYGDVAKNVIDTEKQDYISEINGVYVALTRAKSNLIIAMCGHKMAKNPNVVDILWQAVEESIGKMVKTSPMCLKGSFGKPVFEPFGKTRDRKIENYSFLKPFAPATFEPVKKASFISMSLCEKEVYGQMIHYFLSFLYYNTPYERKLAKSMVYKSFSLYFHKRVIEKALDETTIKLESYPHLFDKNLWTNVYCEYEIFSNGSFYRLDRLMLNKNEKKAFVVDYKTGKLYWEEQLEFYRELVVNLLPNYSVSTEYISF